MSKLSGQYYIIARITHRCDIVFLSLNICRYLSNVAPIRGVRVRNTDLCVCACVWGGGGGECMHSVWDMLLWMCTCVQYMQTSNSIFTAAYSVTHGGCMADGRASNIHSVLLHVTCLVWNSQQYHNHVILWADTGVRHDTSIRPHQSASSTAN